MIDSLPLILSLVLSREALRFEALPRQLGPEDCGPAIARVLLGRDIEDEGPLSLAELSMVLEKGGLRVRARRLDRSGLDFLLARGLSPLVVHYDRPSPHWALVLGKVGEYYQLGDPARGLELLGEADFAGRWSGAVLVPDPAGLPASLLRKTAALRRSEGRRLGLLEAAALDGGVPGRRSQAAVESAPIPAASAAGGLGLSIRASSAAENEGPISRISFSMEFDLEGLSLGLSLPWAFAAGPSTPSMSLEGLELAAVRAFFLRPWCLVLALREGRSGLDACRLSPPREAPRLDFSASLSRIVDPLVIGLEAGLERGSRDGGPWLAKLSLCATEAISDRCFFGFRIGIGRELGAEKDRAAAGRGSLALVAGIRSPGSNLSFGAEDSGFGRELFLEAGKRFPIAIGGHEGP